MRVLVLVVAGLSLLLFACGRASAPSHKGALPSLPSLDRLASGAVDTSHVGSDSLAQSENATLIGQSLYLPGMAGHSEWAIWSFTQPNGMEVQSLALSVKTDEAWVALGDFSKGLWDITGPYTGDVNLAPSAANVSPSGKVFCAVIVYGAHSAQVESLTMTSSGNTPPAAAFTATPQRGDPGDRVALDASAITDDELSTLRYEWDLNDDGLYELNNGNNPLASTVFPSRPGSIEVGLKVTDAGGLTSIATQELVAPDSLQGPQPVDSTELHSFVSMQMVDGNPAMAWARDGWGAVDGPAAYQISFVRAADPAGSSWSAPVAIAGAWGIGVQLLVVAGKPAICWLDKVDYGNGDPTHLCYARALDADGNSWGPVQQLADTSASIWQGGYTSMAIINGQPAIVWCDSERVGYVRALDPNGDTWGSRATVHLEGVTTGASLAEVNGYAAVAFYYKDYIDDPLMLAYNMGIDPDGAGWYPVPLDIYQTPDDTQIAQAQLRIVNGKPAIAHFETKGGKVLYFRALNVDGLDWANPLTIAIGMDWFSAGDLAVIGGVPQIAFVDGLDQHHPQLKVSPAVDADGTSWNPPILVLRSVTPGPSWLPQCAWPCLLDVQGQTGLAYTAHGEQDLRFVRTSL